MITAAIELLAALETGFVLVADLWTITLQDATVILLTSAQRSITYDGDEYLAGVVARRGSIHRAVGFEVSTLEVNLSSTSYTIGSLTLAQACMAGVFDGAQVLLSRAYLTAFGTAPVQVIPRFAGIVAGQEPGPLGVRLSIRSLLDRFNVSYPLATYAPNCVNQVYDANCGLSRATNTESLTVGASSTASSINATLGTATANYYSLGVLTMTAGDCTGQRRSIRSNTTGALVLSIPLSQAPDTGDTFDVYPGCDLAFDGGCAKFSNTDHFRGCPCVPSAESAYA
jgi:uncharacterized phage protein (TIGR02218 family)